MYDFKGKPLIIITGPTAAGKTDLSLSAAMSLNGEIVSADSMQVYKYMDIGTAKIRPQEMQGIRHHLIDFVDPKTDYNIYEFKKAAYEAFEDIYGRGKIPVVTGGTGFYIQALLKDVEFTDEPVDNEYRAYLRQTALRHGNDYLHDRLKEADPSAAEAIHPNNVKRVVRALEYIHNTGALFSEYNEKGRTQEPVFNYYYFVVSMDRARLYDRINKRVDIMREEGLTDEFMKLLDMGLKPGMTSMKGIGYREFFEIGENYLTNNGQSTSLIGKNTETAEGKFLINKDRCKSSSDEGIDTDDLKTVIMEHENEIYEKIRLDTRHFAKRQLTWFRHEKDVILIDMDRQKSPGKARDFILEKIKASV